MTEQTTTDRSSSSTIYSRQFWGILAYLDLLGLPDDATEAAKNILSLHSRFTQCFEPLQRDLGDILQFMAFSDSIIVACEVESHPTGEVISNPASHLYPTREIEFLRALCTFQTMAWSLKLPLRGGISFGEYYWENRSNLTIVCGNPLRQAYDLEESQNWLGMAIVPKEDIPDDYHDTYDTIISDAYEQGLVHLYPVPVSNNPANHTCLWALSWICGNLQSLADDLNRASGRLGGSVADKYRETRDFVRWIANRGGRVQ